MPGNSFAFVGCNWQFAADDSGNQDILIAGPLFSAPITGEVVSISIYVNVAAGHVRVAVYADDTGDPDALLGFSGSVAVVDGWNTIPLSTPAPVTEGDACWLAVHIEDNGLHTPQEGAFGENMRQVYRTGVTYAGGLPDPFGAPDGSAVRAKSIWARLDPA